MNQIAFRSVADVGPAFPLKDGSYTVEISDSTGHKSSMTLVVSENGTKYTAPDKDGKPQTLDSAATVSAFRALMSVPGTGIVLTPPAASSTSSDKKTTTTTTTEPAATPWGLILGAAVVGYLVGKNS